MSPAEYVRARLAVLAAEERRDNRSLDSTRVARRAVIAELEHIVAALDVLRDGSS